MQDAQWHEILQDYVRDDEPPIGLAFQDVSGAINRSRRRRKMIATIGTTAMGIVVAAIIVIPSSPTGHGPAGDGRAGTVAVPPAQNTTMVDTAYVKSAITAALSKSAEFVVQMKLSVGASDGQLLFKTLVDRQTGRYLIDQYDADDAGTLDGASLWEPVGPSTDKVLQVDYSGRTWESTLMGSQKKDAIAFPHTGFSSPAQIQEALTNGSLKVLGRDKIKGKDTIHLGLDGKNSTELWVAADTYLPVQTGSGLHGPGKGLLVEYTWLPRNKANLGKIDLSVPTGFKRNLGDPVSPSPAG